MQDIIDYSALIVVTPGDYLRVESNYSRLIENIPARRIVFVGSDEVGRLVKASKYSDRMDFINENDVVPFDRVHSCMKKAILGESEQELPRGITGWYYQQFLKMQYSRICEDEFYMSWDGDTVPTKNFSMFKEGTDIPYFDMKTEFHPDYFDTISKLFPDMFKCLGKSFISEHMLFDTKIMREMLDELEGNQSIEGYAFWEKIINSISKEKLQSNSFSEFETFGTYVAFRHRERYMLRDWHSIRYGSIYFIPQNMTDDDYEWISRDFDAVTFEKNQEYSEGFAELFTNPEYRAKLSARQIVEAIQAEASEGMKEVWE